MLQKQRNTAMVKRVYGNLRKALSSRRGPEERGGRRVRASTRPRACRISVRRARARTVQGKPMRGRSEEKRPVMTMPPVEVPVAAMPTARPRLRVK